MKILTEVFQKIFMYGLCLVTVCLTLFNCSAPKQPYYFSRYSISNANNSSQLLQPHDSSISNSLNNPDLFASVSQEPIVLSRKSKTELNFKDPSTKKQLSGKQENHEKKTLQVGRKVKLSSQEDPTTTRKKNLKPLWYSIYFLALLIALFTNSLYAVILGGLGLIVIGIMAARKNKEKGTVNPEKNENENTQKTKSRRRGFATAAIIAGVLLLGFVLIAFLAFVIGS